MLNTIEVGPRKPSLKARIMARVADETSGQTSTWLIRFLLGVVLSFLGLWVHDLQDRLHDKDLVIEQLRTNESELRARVTSLESRVMRNERDIRDANR